MLTFVHSYFRPAPLAVSGPGSMWAAVGLVMGTAVGPGILSLPAAALPAGLLPSTVAIVAAWAYVIASVLLVAEATIQVMQETGAREVRGSLTDVLSQHLQKSPTPSKVFDLQGLG
jgi:amino acid permease